MGHVLRHRIREFAIRMSVGGSRGAVLRLVLGQAAKLVSIGICLGLVGAAILARLITTLLFGVAPFDAATLTLVPLLMAAVALVASYIPANRAAKSDPLASL